VLHPDGDGDGADATAFALEVGQDPAAFPLLDGLDVELGQLVPPEGAANQKRKDDVVGYYCPTPAKVKSARLVFRNDLRVELPLVGGLLHPR
jgi:hypothetical protein